MKDWFKLDKKYFKISFYVVVSVCILIVFYQIAANAAGVFDAVVTFLGTIFKLLAPVIYGLIIAYLLYKPCCKLDTLFRKTKYFGNPKHHRASKVTAVILVNVAFIVLLALFFYAIIPSAANSVAQIIAQSDQFIIPLQNFFDNLINNSFVQDIMKYLNIDPNNLASSDTILNLISKGEQFLTSMGTYLFGFILNIGTFLYNFVLGLILAIYINLDLERLRSQFRSFMTMIMPKSYRHLSRVGHLANDMFLKYLIGKTECSLIIGAVYFIVGLIFGVKYSLLMGLIIAVSNMIPIFGPFIGAIPIFLFSILSGFDKAVIMMIAIIGVQQIEGNFLGPKIIGNIVNLSGFWIIVSILVCGKIGGVVGMIIAIPVFAILQTLVGDWIRTRKAKQESSSRQTAEISSPPTDGNGV